MQKITLTTVEADELENVFETASKAQTRSYRNTEIAKNTVYVNTISQYDDAKKVKFVLYMLTKDFRREKDYAFYYGLLQNIFKKKMKMTEDEIITLCDVYHDWFDMFDAVAIKGFVIQALKNLSNISSDEVKQTLRYFCEDMRNADINFAPQRASTREVTIEKIETYLSGK